MLNRLADAMVSNEDHSEYLIYTKYKAHEIEQIGRDDREPEGLTDVFIEVMKNKKCYPNEDQIVINYDGDYYTSEKLNNLSFNDLINELKELIKNPRIRKRENCGDII